MTDYREKARDLADKILVSDMPSPVRELAIADIAAALSEAAEEANKRAEALDTGQVKLASSLTEQMNRAEAAESALAAMTKERDTWFEARESMEKQFSELHSKLAALSARTAPVEARGPKPTPYPKGPGIFPEDAYPKPAPVEGEVGEALAACDRNPEACEGIARASTIFWWQTAQTLARAYRSAIAEVEALNADIKESYQERQEAKDSYSGLVEITEAKISTAISNRDQDWIRAIKRSGATTSNRKRIARELAALSTPPAAKKED